MAGIRRLVAAVATAVAVSLACAPAVGADDYVVKPGDTFGAIARRYGLSVAQLQALNPSVTDVDVVRIGAHLTVPGPAGAAPAPASSDQVVTHVVARGETLGAIASRYGVTVKDITRRNKIANANLVREGTKLTIEISLGGPASYPMSLRRSPDRLALVPHFERAAAEFGVPDDLLKSLAWYESGWRSSARSGVGAIGIGQLMPGTAAFAAEQMGDPSLDPTDPVDNIRMSAWYLRYVLRRYGGNERSALMAYNQGWKRLDSVGPTALARSYADTILAQRAWF